MAEDWKTTRTSEQMKRFATGLETDQPAALNGGVFFLPVYYSLPP